MVQPRPIDSRRNTTSRRAPAPARRRRALVAVAGCVAACAAVWPAAPAFGEGSVDFNVGPTGNRQALAMGNQGASPPDNANRYSVLRVYARAGERIQMGSSAMGLGGGQDNILVYPLGTSFASSTDPTARAPLPSDPVFATEIFDCNVDAAGTGRIASRAQELAGPEAVPDADPNTWTPCEFVAPADGVYPIIMMAFGGTGFPFSSGTVAAPTVTTVQAMAITVWDVTVRGAGGAVQPGRLFSNRLTFNQFGTPTPVTAYFYTPAGYEYRFSLPDHRGQVWDLAANARGVVDAATGARIFSSFQWGIDDLTNTLAHTEALAPQMLAPDLGQDTRYPIFFRRPDPVAISGPGGLAALRGYATSALAPSGTLTALSFTAADGRQGVAAPGSGGAFTFASPPQMNGLGYSFEIDLNGNGTYGDSGDFVRTDDLSSSGNSVAWNGLTPSGATPACGRYGYRVRSTLAEVHLTQSDVEASPGGTQIERLSLPSDPALGNQFAASYNDIDPYKGTAITNASPSAVSDGTSGPGFHAWTGNAGNADFVDTWMRLPEVASSGSLQVLCVHDLSIKKTASDTRATVGDTITYTLTATNAGPDPAPDVTVTDTAPSQLDVRSATTSEGRCTVAGNKISCVIGTLAAGASAKVTVKTVAIKAGQTTNTAIIAAPAPAVDPAANNTGEATVRVVKPTLQLTKTADRGSVRAGQAATYTIRVRNPSKRSVRNVRVCDRLPSGLVYVSSKTTARLTKSGYCWTTKRLWAGRSKTYRITLRALTGASGRKVNRATAGSSAANTARATRTIRVLAARVLGGGVTG
jgi:uncharacterized repeat protein (TIGR01451 family)